jgi:hypothetical protein
MTNRRSLQHKDGESSDRLERYFPALRELPMGDAPDGQSSSCDVCYCTYSLYLVALKVTQRAFISFIGTHFSM